MAAAGIYLSLAESKALVSQRRQQRRGVATPAASVTIVTAPAQPNQSSNNPSISSESNLPLGFPMLVIPDIAPEIAPPGAGLANGRSFGDPRGTLSTHPRPRKK